MVLNKLADPAGFAAVLFVEKGGYKAGERRFDPDGLSLCQAGLPTPVKFTFTARVRAVIAHQRACHVYPLLHPEPTGDSCLSAHKRWPKGGCTAEMPNGER